MNSLADKPINAVATVDGYTQYGMTLLEHYAGQQMAALRGCSRYSGYKSEEYAAIAVADACALIAELEKVQTP